MSSPSASPATMTRLECAERIIAVHDELDRIRVLEQRACGVMDEVAAMSLVERKLGRVRELEVLRALHAHLKRGA